MEQINFDAVYDADYSIEQVVALPQYWSEGRSYQTPESGRSDSGLMLMLSIENIMTVNKETICSKRGQIIYLPQGMKYRANFKNPVCEGTYKNEITNYLVNFTAKSPNGTPLALSDKIIVLTPNNFEHFRKIFEDLALECKNAAFPPALLKATVYEILTELSKQFKGKSISNKNSAILAPVMKYISVNCFQTEISVSELSKLSHISESTLRRIFYASFGMSPKDYINSLKLNRAKVLLRSNSLTIAEISRLIGFEDPSYFSRFFKKKTGVSPTQY